ncbi:endoglucanase 16-like [Gossypium australe]|uniref:Endoglucanase n=1 Tax=Gossypium australe TaxID=47621 RepID=A0A5B6VGD5_9ROSI|nr:endoglucanase 16-like [Gossypium australe]
MGTKTLFAAVLITWLAVFQCCNGHDFNYKEALTKSLMFLEAQRSGKLPANNRIPWRGDSALDDGKEANVDLVGGYYDAGDNVKYGMPMAFTITTLAWSAIAYEKELKAAGEMGNVHSALRWGTDYFLKCGKKRGIFYVQVGDPVEDHKCWVRPENMKTPRTVLQINETEPGTEIAAETSAAMAASSILFYFGKRNKGTFDGECPFYCSFSGYNDELLWAASWLYTATHDQKFRKFITEEAVSAVVDEFNWDLKYAGIQVLLSDEHADSYICSVLPQSPYFKVPKTPGGLIHLRDGANLQYVTGVSFLFSIYGDLLQRHNLKVKCDHHEFDASSVLNFAKQQMDYILGANPLGRSYMVGFGKNPPTQAHHRGASIPLSEANEDINCGMSFARWFNKDSPNPNELTGAILGGPDKQDKFSDLRWTSIYTEPCTYVNSLAVAALAKLTCHK